MRVSGTFKRTMISKGPEETLAIARRIGKRLKAGDILALKGGLGGGKTHFVKGLALGLKTFRPQDVRSPTFALIHEYKGKPPLCHADLYRLKPSEVFGLGLEEYWEAAGRWVVAVEWADRAPRLIPKGALWIAFKMISPTSRRITFSGDAAWKKYCLP
ncbi:MAG: tRNA (adenosine(37)-N6)-threonylcarbamoyltransferase complex ATPase subunit type 1 TsaE [Elusimicrobia bacterium RIFCSPLOWO2_01_FULL_54_10]|nr:MAG: tRNA (adenosine(37)-N6)-threonylcarbamoyltransferase complex ATPase subunit type 1 TsaE [Elusimicrobia bacterium RIFCSPLOWO2_01_FULL_54_10]